MQKNVRTIVASAVCLLAVLMGALLWPRSSQPTPNARAQGLSVAANHDMVQRNYAQAIEKYRQSLEIQPDPDNQIALALALLKVSKRTEAIQLVKEVAQGQSHAKQSAAKILAKMERDPNWGAPKP